MKLYPKFIPAPYPYFGNKYKLLSAIFDLVPDDVTHFYDLFGGSGVVSHNAKLLGYNVTYNDTSKLMYMLQEIICYHSEEYNKLLACVLDKFNIQPENDNNRAAVRDGKSEYFIWLKDNIDYLAEIEQYMHLIMYSRCKVLQRTRDAIFYLTTNILRTNSIGDRLPTLLQNNYLYLDDIENTTYQHFTSDLVTDCYYLDPPYLTTDITTYENQFNLDDFKSWLLTKYNATIIISYNNCKQMEELLLPLGFIFTDYSFKYNVGKSKNKIERIYYKV